MDYETFVTISRVLLVLLLLPALQMFSLAARAGDQEALTILTSRRAYPFRVEVVSSAAALERGLMFRTEVPPDTGMLFDFGGERPLAMWMKNTLVPLDMLFIDAEGDILRIAENATPLSLTPIASGRPAAAVLEVAGGICRRYGIRAGDKVEHSMFAVGR